MKLFAVIVISATALAHPAWAHRCELTCRQFEEGGSRTLKYFCAEEYTPQACVRRAINLSKQTRLSCRPQWADHCRLGAVKVGDPGLLPR